MHVNVVAISRMQHYSDTAVRCPGALCMPLMAQPDHFQFGVLSPTSCCQDMCNNYGGQEIQGTASQTKPFGITLLHISIYNRS